MSTKFLPTIMNLIKRLAEEGQVPATNNPQRNPALATKTYRNENGTSSDMSTASSGLTHTENGMAYSSSSKDD